MKTHWYKIADVTHIVHTTHHYTILPYNWKTAQTFNKFHGKNHQNHNNIDSKCHPSFISLCRNPSAWCSKHHIFRFLILESGLYGIVNQYVPPDDDGDSLKVVPHTIYLFDVYFSPWVDTSLENILCLLIFFFHLTWFFKKRLWMHCTLSIQSYAYYLQLGMLIKWQTLREHFYCRIQHMFYCYFIWFYQIEFNCNTNLK